MTATRAGLVSISPARRAISGGMVAEKNSVWRSLGSRATIFRMSLMKPMSSMRSASSRTRTSTQSSVTARFLHQVHETPGRGDENVDAAGEGADLLAHRHAADGERGAPLEVPAIGPEAVEDLRRELARRAEHEHAAALRRRASLGRRKAVEDRQREGRGLAGPGLGDADEVAPGEDDRNRRRLDRRRVGVALVSERTKNGLGEAEVSEFHGYASAF